MLDDVLDGRVLGVAAVATRRRRWGRLGGERREGATAGGDFLVVAAVAV